MGSRLGKVLNKSIRGVRIEPKVLHGIWLPPSFGPEAGGIFFLWAEGLGPSRRLSRTRPPSHPFALAPVELRADLPGLREALEGEQGLYLPTQGTTPQASHPSLQEVPEPTVVGPITLSAWRVRGLSLRSDQVVSWLVSLPSQEDFQSRGLVLADDLRFWQAAAHLVLRILFEEQFLPSVSQWNEDGSKEAVWEPLLDAPGISEAVQHLVESMPPVCLSFSCESALGKTGVTAQELLHGFLRSAVDAEVRLSLAEVRGSLPKPSTLQDIWLKALTEERSDPKLPKEAVKPLEEALASWRRRLRAASDDGLRICLRLHPPAEDSKRWRLEYLLQATSDPSLLVKAEQLWGNSTASRRLAVLCKVNPEERLLAALGLAGRIFSPIEKSLKGPRPSVVFLDAAHAYRFLKESSPVLAGFGFGIFLPPWWKAQDSLRLGIQLSLRPKQSSEAFGFDTGLQLNWAVALGQEALTVQELEELAEMKVPLVQIRGQWVEADPEALKKALDFWRRHDGQDMTLGEVFGLIRQQSALGLGPIGVSDLKGEGWIGTLLSGTSASDGFTLLPVPEDLQGRLRPYQERGFSWLSFLQRYGFGACLADDMGLGKTVQALAFLLREKTQGRLRKPSLLLCPTSVVGNWQKEAQRFAPTLKVLIHHGAERCRSNRSLMRRVRSYDLVVSTYALARLDREILSSQEWAGILLDEAQNIKNPQALQTQATRALKGRFRIALTGTPIENRLSELWSIMDLLNPGYLGGFDDFYRRFAVPIERFQDSHAAQTLRRMVQPFILRRLKTDPKIISDLPEKLEMKVFCTITREQATLYQAVVKDMMEKIEASEGIQRRGLVLAALTKLKQVLNHPAHFLKDGSALAGRSGKMERLTEMLEEAISEGDSALIFTQYTEMGELLQRRLQASLFQETLFFHGGLLTSAREKLVERFQAGHARLMVLTLKAGGLGLNLTRANHVFHYDRWWNPAVENQATDRVFRIGQTKRVQAHKFICLGTLEEKIDRMIESKKALGEKILGAGEQYLTEISNAQLKEIFTLRAEAFEAME